MVSCDDTQNHDWDLERRLVRGWLLPFSSGSYAMTAVNDHLFNQRDGELRAAFRGKIVTPLQYLEAIDRVKTMEAQIIQMNHDLLEARKKEVHLLEQRQRLLIGLTFLGFMVAVETLVLIAMTCK
jgi:hypothetical protein